MTLLNSEVALAVELAILLVATVVVVMLAAVADDVTLAAGRGMEGGRRRGRGTEGKGEGGPCSGRGRSVGRSGLC